MYARLAYLRTQTPKLTAYTQFSVLVIRLRSCVKRVLTTNGLVNREAEFSTPLPHRIDVP